MTMSRLFTKFVLVVLQAAVVMARLGAELEGKHRNDASWLVVDAHSTSPKVDADAIQHEPYMTVHRFLSSSCYHYEYKYTKCNRSEGGDMEVAAAVASMLGLVIFCVLTLGCLCRKAHVEATDELRRDYLAKPCQRG